MFLWIRLNSELLRYQGVQNFAKNNTENAELASKMLKQQHFLYQRKNLYDLMPSRSFSGDPTSDDNSRFHPCWSSFLFPSHRTLYLLVWRWGEGVAEHKASWMVTYTLKNTTHSRVSKPPEWLLHTQINIDQQPSIKDSWAGNICKSS